jgi:hypothetical protein
MILPCPACPHTVQVSDVDPDSSLADMYDHLHVHTWDPGEHTALFVQAQERAR